jgi:hypothetical protein
VPSVVVYRFKIYDHSTGHMELSPHWATRRAVEQPGAEGPALGIVLPETGIEVDSMALNSQGMTAPGFDPLFNRTAGG